MQQDLCHQRHHKQKVQGHQDNKQDKKQNQRAGSEIDQVENNVYKKEWIHYYLQQ